MFFKRKITVKKLILSITLFLYSIIIINTPAFASVSDETAYVLNTFSFLVHGFLVMLMAAGFAMLESGLVRSKNTAAICLKNIALYSTAGLVFYLIGYNVMYVDVGSYFGSFSFLYNPSADELALINAEDATAEQVNAVVSSGYSVASDWFFQMVFVATAASIVSGTIAERIKVWPFIIFVVFLSAIIYPVQASWTWGGGFLADMGFSDFAGSTLVHSCGGWAALMGAIIIGSRKGRFTDEGSKPMPGANLPLATLGTFILWFGWFGFNGGSQLALGSALDATAISIVYVNTNLAAAAGVITAMILSQVFYGKMDLTMCLNGALAGLVAITAGPDLQNHLTSIIVGAIGSALAVFAVPILDKFKIDDVVGAIPVHLVAGIWGTLAVGIFGAGSFMTQLYGIIAVGIFVSIASGIVWYGLSLTIGLRPTEEEEELGLDKSELGLEAYPDFTR
ncbi:MAG: ammonium transporter [Alphaproteobacteria bacterium TMED87]|nr:MAG: ammonium transporter [Alphaproteobacteria bacterium TMED87]